ncbi:hypothetical protein C8F04DRAFT_1344195 [Mycena alexandri]|uniref:Uncharacterized protein n=1 Tax=Mycena alexandri TaxID=1745969 RepID=A0AAD6TEY3_9AGAR|nr:hypothetical protein C8F04DRAFT_1331814 [Mycena alexandri]KAJ7045316.1 hypothetical protein C8F04DRAFT_1344195 [Mycena alexandri]
MIAVTLSIRPSSTPQAYLSASADLWSNELQPSSTIGAEAESSSNVSKSKRKTYYAFNYLATFSDSAGLNNDSRRQLQGLSGWIAEGNPANYLHAEDGSAHRSATSSAIFLHSPPRPPYIRRRARHQTAEQSRYINAAITEVWLTLTITTITPHSTAAHAQSNLAPHPSAGPHPPRPYSPLLSGRPPPFARDDYPDNPCPRLAIPSLPAISNLPPPLPSIRPTFTRGLRTETPLA